MTVTLDHVTRTVEGIPHIRDVSLTLESGTLNVLLGPTLSGKTSIMRLLAGLDKPTTGKVLVNGKDVTGVDVRKRSVAMVYQQFINYPSLTVYENIASPLRVQGKPREEIETRVAEAARLLRLEPFLKRTPLQLSGGQQQRTAIARALVKGADLVLLDEPLANLDYKLREELRDRAAAHLRGVRRDLRLCHDRADRGAAARRQHGLHVGGAGAPVRRDAERLPPSADAARRRRCSPIRRSTSSASRRRTALCNMPAASPRRPPVSMHRSPTAPIASASAPISSPSPTARPTAIAFHATVTVTEITGSESFVHLTRDGIELGRGAARRARVRARPDASMPCSIPTMSSCSTRPTAWSPRRRSVREMRHGPHRPRRSRPLLRRQ